MKQFIKVTLLSVIGVLLLVLLVTGGNILFFWTIFNWLQNIIHSLTGFDTTITKALVALILAILVMLPFGKIALSFTPIPQKKKSFYRASLFAGIAVFFILAFFASRNIYFDPQTGKPAKYYSQWPNGEYHFYSEPGFDTITGDSLREVTSEVSIKNNGLWSSKGYNFDPETGESVKYYSQWPNGEYHFYSEPGFDSTTGDTLKRVTKEISLKAKGLWPTDNYDFDPVTGEPLKYYSQMPNGEYKIYSGPGFDPVTGDTLKKITREVSLKAKGLWPPEVPATEPPKKTRSDILKERLTMPRVVSLPSIPKETHISDPTTDYSKTESTVSNHNDKVTTSTSVSAPVEYKVIFHNETEIRFKVYNLAGHMINVIEPGQTKTDFLVAGRYYHVGNNITHFFTIKKKGVAHVNFFRHN